MTVFDELVALDRPFVPVKFKIGTSEVSGFVRRLSAADVDALEADYADTYAKLIVEKTESQNGKESELERVLRTYSLRPRHEILEQVLGTRYNDIQTLASELAGINPQKVQAEASSIEDVEARQAFLEPLEKAYREAYEQSKEQIGHEYDTKSDEELVSIIAQVNVNIQALREARTKQDAYRLYYSLYNADKERFVPSIEKVKLLQPSTIASILKVIDLALVTQVAADLPFESPGVHEPAGQPSSPSISAEDTTVGGEPTATAVSA